MIIFIWILAGIAAYNLWDETLWLAVVALVAAFSYMTRASQDSSIQQSTGEYPDVGVAYLIELLVVIGIFIYALL